MASDGGGAGDGDGKEHSGGRRGRLGKDEGKEIQRGGGERGRGEKEKKDRGRLSTLPDATPYTSPRLPIAVRVSCCPRARNVM